MAAAFREYLHGRPSSSSIWPGKWNERAAEMLRGDLDAANIPYRDAEGVADFHALRHSYVSLLGRMGNSPKVTQTLARHSDIRLTMNVYSHAQIHDLASAVDGLPIGLPNATKANVQALQATGTDGKAQTVKNATRRDHKRLLFPCREGDSVSGNMRSDDEGNESEDDPDGNPQVIGAIEDEERMEGLRTDDGETTPPGFEPGQREPKSLVLPLHYGVSENGRNFQHHIHFDRKIKRDGTWLGGPAFVR